MTRGLFVTGTDTGVGKTTVSCALVAALARRGRKIGVMKPCETGGGDDAERLIRMSGRALSPAQVRPYAFALPAAPEVAATAEGREVSLAPIRAAFAAIAADSDALLVEGAGGLLVPLAPDLLTIDLAAALALPLLIVARASLGTINHTLLTLSAARQRGLDIAGVVLCRTHSAAGPDEPTNPEAIARHGRVRILGTLPHLDPALLDDPPTLAALAELHLADVITTCFS